MEVFTHAWPSRVTFSDAYASRKSVSELGRRAPTPLSEAHSFRGSESGTEFETVNCQSTSLSEESPFCRGLVPPCMIMAEPVAVIDCCRLSQAILRPSILFTSFDRRILRLVWNQVSGSPQQPQGDLLLPTRSNPILE